MSNVLQWPLMAQDVAASLRRMADRIDAGEQAVHRCIVITDPGVGAEGGVEVFGLGARASDGFPLAYAIGMIEMGKATIMGLTASE